MANYINRETLHHDEKLDRKRIRLTRFVSFLMGFSQAVLAYIMSSYFKLASGTENVGVFYAFAYIVVLLVFLNLHKLVRKFGKADIFYFSLLFKIVVITLLVFAVPGKLGLLLLMVYIIFGNIEWVALDMILESFSEDRMSGRIRGLHLTIMNAGILLGPFLSTSVLDKFNFYGIFILVLILNAAVFVVALVGFRHVNHRFDQDLKVLDIIRKLMARKNIMRIYYISFVLEFFYALMLIYTPLYLRDLGIPWSDIGIIFTIMLVPFVLLQYPAGFLADKKMGEKELLIGSLMIMGISTATIFFITGTSVVLWASILFLTRIGACLIEILRDSYFYKRIDARDVDIINFFRNSSPVAYVLAAIISSCLIFFLPIRFAFILVGLVIFSALYPAFKLNDNKCEREILGAAKPKTA